MTPEQIALLDGVVKTQRIRALDIFVIGPLMAWGGLRLRHKHPVSGSLLAFFGATTIWYNARNYVTVSEALKRTERDELRRMATRAEPG
jgi:hypothetical protein